MSRALPRPRICAAVSAPRETDPSLDRGRPGAPRQREHASVFRWPAQRQRPSRAGRHAAWLSGTRQRVVADAASYEGCRRPAGSVRCAVTARGPDTIAGNISCVPIARVRAGSSSALCG
jgi:hypothetical protein